MSLVLNESLVLAKTRSQDLKSVLKLNCWGSGIKDVSLVRQLVNVEVIGLSCNEITTLEDFAYCSKLRQLILRKNKIKNISEIAHLQGLPKLTSLWLDENPCAENTHNYRKVVLKALPQLTVLDNKPVTREELQEIEELGNEIYEEIPYESSNSSGSGPYSGRLIQPGADQCENQNNDNQPSQQQQQDYQQQGVNASSYQEQQSINEMSYYQPTNETMNETSTSVHQYAMNDSMLNKSRSTQLQQSRCFPSQGSLSALNVSQHQNWPSNNNNMLPKGGKSRNGNILSAVLCLVKELDYVSCEVVQTALHCRMEETSQ